MVNIAEAGSTNARN